MATALRQNADYEMVLGYSPYAAMPGALNAWVRFETVYTALQYVALAQIGLPYMGVGRNLLYRKALFAQHGGLLADADLLSGDDDLFVRRAATARNTTVCLHPHSFVVSAPKTTWAGYLQQKRRHLTTSVRYSLRIQLILGSLSGSLLGFYALLLAQIGLGSPFLGAAAALFLLRLCVANALFYKVCAVLRAPRLSRWFAVLDGGLWLYLGYFAAFFWRKPKNW